MPHSEFSAVRKREKIIFSGISIVSAKTERKKEKMANEKLRQAKAVKNNDDGNNICDRETSGFYEGGAF